MIPLNPVRRLISDNCPYHVSLEAVMGLRDFLENIAGEMAGSAADELKKLNQGRERQGLKPLKRLNGWVVRKVCDNVLNGDTVKDRGLQSTVIVGPGGKKMSAQTKATKSAKEDDRSTGGHNGL